MKRDDEVPHAWDLLLLALALMVMCALPLMAAAQPAADAATLDHRLSAREIAPGVHVVAGANADFSPANGCNIINTGFIVTGAGVVVIDTGPSRRYGEQLRALIQRTTREPLVRVVNLNLHPDHFLGNQAFADVPRHATAATRAGMQREAASYEDNLFRLCGAWMTGTQALLPDQPVVAGTERIGAHELEWLELRGHTDSDLVLLDRRSGVLFAGGLVFSQRAPTTPHARLAHWRASLRRLAALTDGAALQVVPSHGQLPAAQGVSSTLRHVDWLDARLRDAAAQGLEMNELLRLPVPAEFRAWAAFDAEYVRSVAHLYPRYEQEALAR